MSGLDALRACAGSWQGANAVILPGDAPHTSETTLRLNEVVSGRFVQLAYTWAFDGASQEGLLLIGGDPEQPGLDAVWMDSWHMGHALMRCAGTASDGVIDLRGSYAAPEGPDWGWRIAIEPAADQLRIRMYNITPEGEEFLGVEATYTRA